MISECSLHSAFDFDLLQIFICENGINILLPISFSTLFNGGTGQLRKFCTNCTCFISQMRTIFVLFRKYELYLVYFACGDEDKSARMRAAAGCAHGCSWTCMQLPAVLTYAAELQRINTACSWPSAVWTPIYCSILCLPSGLLYTAVFCVCLLDSYILQYSVFAFWTPIYCSILCLPSGLLYTAVFCVCLLDSCILQYSVSAFWTPIYCSILCLTGITTHVRLLCLVFEYW